MEVEAEAWGLQVQRILFIFFHFVYFFFKRVQHADVMFFPTPLFESLIT